jgi:Carboxypeptidase regulatory-like domain
MSRVARTLAALFLFLPAPIWAQGTATISGTVRDATGAVLPGVTIEASSPALIEKVRVGTSDGSGEYQVVSLPPGIYAVTFSLTGFSSVRREGIELTTGFTAQVNADMRVGAMEETITVTGDSPIVDVQNVKRQVVVTRDVVDALPTGKTAVEVATLIPGVQLMNGTGAGAAATGMGGSLGMDQFATLAAHGSRPADTRLEVNGVNINIFGQRQDSTYANFQDGTVQEYSFEISAHSAESETGGVRVNIVPKDGGNRYSGQVFFNYADDNFQSQNMTDELRATGLRDPDRTVSLWTLNPAVGGPIRQDRVWFYAGYSRMVNERLKANTYFNTDLAAWRPVFDTTRQATALERTNDTNIRLTWQAAAKHKLSFYYAHNTLCQCPYLIGATYVGINAPEGATMAPRTTDLAQVNWSAPVTGRVLLEAAYSHPRYTKGHDAYVEPLAPRIVEASNGLGFRGPNPSLYFDDENRTPVVKGSISYVTGTHAIKAGATYRNAYSEQFYEVDRDLTYNTLNYRPTSVTYHATPYYPRANEQAFGLFVQDQWTLNDMTLNLGLRYDFYEQGYPDIYLPPTQYVPNERRFAATTLVGWKDLSPRVGVAYDLGGNGRTAIKASISRYNVQGLFLNDQNPARANVMMTRQWTDPNGDFIVQGDPLNPAINGELGASQNLNFGREVIPYNFDPDFAFGFGVRPYNWEASASVQHELMRGVSVNLAYYRRMYGNFQVNDNLLVAPTDYSPYSVNAPVDPRLPDGGAYPITDLWDLNNNKVGQIRTITTSSSKYGDQTEHWNGLDLSAQARLSGELLLQGGFSTGKTTTDNCDVAPKLDNPSQRFCRNETPYLTQFKFGGSYVLPWDVQVSGTIQSFVGPAIQANATFTNAQIAPTLGRNLSQGTTAAITLLEPNTMYNDRVNQLDVRFAKTFRIGPTRLKGMIDIFNATNNNTITNVNNSYGTTGASWLVPTSISLARLFKIGAQFDF